MWSTTIRKEWKDGAPSTKKSIRSVWNGTPSNRPRHPPLRTKAWRSLRLRRSSPLFPFFETMIDPHISPHQYRLRHHRRRRRRSLLFIFDFFSTAFVGKPSFVTDRFFSHNVWWKTWKSFRKLPFPAADYGRRWKAFCPIGNAVKTRRKKLLQYKNNAKLNF